MAVKWTDADKAAAVDAYVTSGNLAEAQRAVERDGEQPGKNTIKRWASAAGHDISEITARAAAKTKEATEASSRKWQERRADMVHELGDWAQVAVDLTGFLLTVGNPKDAKDAALTAAILIDKAQVLSGDASSVVRLPWDSPTFDAVRADAHARGEALKPHLVASDGQTV